MTDVLIVGGGPAGSIAALVLARAGVDVTILDRAVFPRDKLCGDSVNPGAMALLARHGLAADVESARVADVGHAGDRARRRRRARALSRRRRRTVDSATRPRCAAARRGRSRRRACRAGRARRGPRRRRRRRHDARHRRVDADGQGVDQPACSCRHCRRWPAVVAGPGARARAPPPSRRAAGRSAPISRASPAVWTSARCTSAADTTSASRRFPVGWPTRAWWCPRHVREPSGLPRPWRWSSALRLTSNSGRDSVAHAARRR